MKRSPGEIIALLELTIDSCLEIAKIDDSISEDEKAIIDKLTEWKLKLEPQIMEILEANLDESDFYDIFHQLLSPVVDAVFEQARMDGKITEEEQKLLDNIVDKLRAKS
ncbi:MAG: TerB family tellurite resistance protein [Promethearchaeota archaeon]